MRVSFGTHSKKEQGYEILSIYGMTPTIPYPKTAQNYKQLFSMLRIKIENANSSIKLPQH